MNSLRNSVKEFLSHRKVISIALWIAILLSVFANESYDYVSRTLIHFGLIGPDVLITVQLPAIHTRERLMNDRLEQVAWIEQQLESTKTLSPPALADAARPPEVVPNSKPTAEGADGNETAREGTEKTGPKTDTKLAASRSATADFRLIPDPLNWFRAVDSYRDVLRAERALEMLDDRHDMDGSELYLLSFETSVVAGPASDGYAVIDATLSYDGQNEETHDGTDRPEQTKVTWPGQEDAARRIKALHQADLIDVYYDWLQRAQELITDRVKINQQSFNQSVTFTQLGSYNKPLWTVERLICQRWIEISKVPFMAPGMDCRRTPSTERNSILTSLAMIEAGLERDLTVLYRRDFGLQVKQKLRSIPQVRPPTYEQAEAICKSLGTSLGPDSPMQVGITTFPLSVTSSAPGTLGETATRTNHQVEAGSS